MPSKDFLDCLCYLKKRRHYLNKHEEIVYAYMLVALAKSCLMDVGLCAIESNIMSVMGEDYRFARKALGQSLVCVSGGYQTYFGLWLNHRSLS